MLGYKHGFPEIESTYGPAKKGEVFWGSHLQCQGDEESLEDCRGKENPSCTRGEVAGVTCFLGGMMLILFFFMFKLNLIMIIEQSFWPGLAF